MGHSNNLSILKNNSTSAALLFATAVTTAFSQDLIAVAVADFNGDNKPDILCSNRFGTNILTKFKNKLGVTDVALCPPVASTSLQ